MGWSRVSATHKHETRAHQQMSVHSGGRSGRIGFRVGAHLVRFCRRHGVRCDIVIHKYVLTFAAGSPLFRTRAQMGVHSGGRSGRVGFRVGTHLVRFCRRPGVRCTSKTQQYVRTFDAGSPLFRPHVLAVADARAKSVLVCSACSLYFTPRISFSRRRCRRRRIHECASHPEPTHSPRPMSSHYSFASNTFGMPCAEPAHPHYTDPNPPGAARPSPSFA